MLSVIYKIYLVWDFKSFLNHFNILGNTMNQNYVNGDQYYAFQREKQIQSLVEWERFATTILGYKLKYGSSVPNLGGKSNES